MKAHMVAMSSAEHLPDTAGLPHQACGSLLALMWRQLQVPLQLHPQPTDRVISVIMCIVQEKPLINVPEILAAKRMARRVLRQTAHSQVARTQRLSIAQQLSSKM